VTEPVRIIDAHHHLWDTTRIRYPLFEQIPPLHRPFLAPEYDAVAVPAGVTGAVCVEVASVGADGLREARWLVEEVARSAVTDRIVVWAPIDEARLDDYLDAVRALRGPIAGVRRSFEFDPPDFPRRPEVIAGVRRLGARGLPFDLVLFRPSLSAVGELARACPDTQLILDHLGKPNVKAGMDRAWRRHIAELGALEHVACKISGLVMEADREHWTREDMKPFIDHVIACFGFSRVMFGSDWPMCQLAGGYKKWLDAVRWAVQGASEGEKQALFETNARRIYYRA
jgi:L-fuconolactonase